MTKYQITHHCDTCGNEVEEFCQEHPKALIVSVRSEASKAAANLGSVRTPKKAAASAANGKKGGRPPVAQHKVTDVREATVNGSRKKLFKLWTLRDGAYVFVGEFTAPPRTGKANMIALALGER